jgi:hypothetical protein
MVKEKETVSQKRFSLSENLINEVLKYLGSKPYGEVANIIAAIRQDAKQVEEIFVPTTEQVEKPKAKNKKD